MNQVDNTISSMRSLSGQLSSDENSSVYTPSIFFGMESSSTVNTTCSPIIITLLIGLLITFNKKLHTPSTKNTVIIVTAIIATFPVVAVLCYFNYWYYSVIIQIAATVTIIVSLIPGISNWRKFLFAIACLFTITVILFTIVGIIFKTDDRLRVSIQII
ncbi:hypothetical protein KSF78_0007860 [Schistosoma japonicum]|nr:hypothetical protein KSF78_0007860 [Schistosoma japonicum]